PLASHKSVKPGQLAGEKYVGFDKGLVIRREVDHFLREHGVAVGVGMEFDNNGKNKKAVEISAGVGLVPQPTFRRAGEAGTLVAVPLAGCRLVRPLGIIYERHHRLNSSILRFIDMLREEEHGHTAPSATGNGQSNGTITYQRSNGLRRRRTQPARRSRGKV